jgi:hypothetical protein
MNILELAERFYKLATEHSKSTVSLEVSSQTYKVLSRFASVGRAFDNAANMVEALLDRLDDAKPEDRRLADDAHAVLEELAELKQPLDDCNQAAKNIWFQQLHAPKLGSLKLATEHQPRTVLIHGRPFRIVRVVLGDPYNDDPEAVFWEGFYEDERHPALRMLPEMEAQELEPPHLDPTLLERIAHLVLSEARAEADDASQFVNAVESYAEGMMKETQAEYYALPRAISAVEAKKVMEMALNQAKFEGWPAGLK